jgi:hypothetical protein
MDDERSDPYRSLLRSQSTLAIPVLLGKKYSENAGEELPPPACSILIKRKWGRGKDGEESESYKSRISLRLLE